MTGTTLHIPTLVAGDLTLRAPAPRDFDAYAAFRASPRSVTVGGPYDRNTAFHQFCGLVGHWQMRGFGRWIVADTATDTPLGIVGLFYPESWPEPEIGWSVFDAAEGRSVAYHAALAARSYAYDVLGWTTVISGIAPTNTRSLALAKRMGAQRDGSFVDPTHGEVQIWRHLSPADAARSLTKATA